MSGQSTKKKRLGSRRMVGSRNEASDATVGTSVAQHHVPEGSIDALKAPSLPYNSNSEDQHPVSPDVPMNRRKLGSRRRNKERHVKDSETEPFHEPGEEVEENRSSNRNPKATEISVATQLEKLDEIYPESDQDLSLSQKSCLDSVSTPDFYSEVKTSSSPKIPEEVMEILIPTDENKLEGIEKSDIMQSQEIKLNPHDVGISMSATIRVLSYPSVDKKLIDLQPSNTMEKPDEELSNVYTVHELTSKTRDENIMDSEYLQSPSMESEPHVESVVLDIVTSEITKNKSGPRDILESEQTIFFRPKKVSANQQQDELFTISESEGAQHSVDVVNSEYDSDVMKTKLQNLHANLDTAQSLILEGTENVCPVEADIQNIPKHTHLDNSPGVDELTETSYEHRNRRKLGSSRRNKGRQKINEFKEDFLENTRDDDAFKNVANASTERKEQEDLSQGTEDDMSMSHDSSLCLMSTLHSSSEILGPSLTNYSESDQQSLSAKSETLEDGQDERETGFKVEAPEKSMTATLDEEDKTDTLKREEVRGAQHSEDVIMEPTENKSILTQIQEIMPQYYTSESIQNGTTIGHLKPWNPVDQAETRNLFQSEVMLESTDDVTTKKEASDPNEKQDKHHCKLSQKNEVGGQVEYSAKLNAEQTVKQNKDSVAFEPEESHLSFQILPTGQEELFDSQLQDKSSSAEEQTETDYDYSRTRRKLSSSSRNKGRQKIKEFKEEISGITTNDDTPRITPMPLMPRTKEEELDQGYQESIILSVSHDTTRLLISSPGFSSEIPQPSVTTCPETDLQSLSAKSETLEEDPDKRETGFKVEMSEKSPEATPGDINESNTFESEEVRGAQHSEVSIMKPPKEETKSTHIQEIMPKYYTSESVQNDTTVGILQPWTLADQAETMTPHHSELMVESGDDVTTKMEDSDLNEKQDDHHYKLDQKYEEGDQEEKSNDKFNPEKNVYHNKGSVTSEPEESDFSVHILPTEQRDLFDSQPQDKSSSADKKTEIDYNHSGNRRKLSSSHRKNRSQTFQKYKEEVSENTKDDDTHKTRPMTLTQRTDQKELSQRKKEDIIMSMSHDSSRFLTSTLGSSSEIPQPSLTNYPETDLQNLSLKSETLEEDQDERETGFKVEASEKSMEATLDEEDKSHSIERGEVSGAQHSEDDIMKPQLEEIQSTHTQEIMPQYYTSENAQNDTRIGHLESQDLIDQAETRNSYESKVMLESTDDVTAKKEDSNPNEEQDDHCSNLVQKYEGGGQVENSAKLNAELTVKQNKDSVTSEPDESNFSFQILPTGQEELFDSQHQDKCSSAEEQTETGYDHSRTRRKLGSSRRNKGRQKIKERKEEISGITKNDDTPRITPMTLTSGTEEEELSQENNEAMSVLQDTAMLLISSPGHSSEIPQPSVTTCLETDLQSFPAESETLEEDPDERERSFKQRVSEKSLETALDEVDKSDTFEREEVRGVQHSEEAVMKTPEEELKSTCIMPRYYTPESAQNSATIGNLEHWDLIDQAETRTPYQSNVMVESTGDVTPKKEDSGLNEKQDDHCSNLVVKYEGGGQVENDGKLNAELKVYHNKDSAISEPEESIFSFQTQLTEQNYLFEPQPPKIETLEEDQDEREVSFKVELTDEATLGKLYQSDTLESEETRDSDHSDDDQTLKKDVQSRGIQQILQGNQASEIVTKDVSHNSPLSENPTDEGEIRQTNQFEVIAKSSDDSIEIKHEDSDPGDKESEDHTKETHIEVLDQSNKNHNLHHSDKPIDERDRAEKTQDGTDKSEAKTSSTEETFQQEKEELFTEIDENNSSLENLDLESAFNDPPQNYSVEKDEKTELSFHLSGNRRKLASSRRKKRGQFDDAGGTEYTNARMTKIPFKEVETKETLVETSLKEIDKCDTETFEVNIQRGTLVCQNEIDLPPKDELPTKEETFSDVKGSQCLEDAEKPQISCIASLRISQDDLIPSGEKTPHQENKELFSEMDEFKHSLQSFQCQTPALLDSQPQRNDTASSHGGKRGNLGVSQENSVETMDAKGKSRISNTEDVSDKAKQNPHFGTGMGISEVTSPMAEQIKSSSNKMSEEGLQTVYSVSENRENNEGIELKLKEILQGKHFLTHVDSERTESFDIKEISEDKNSYRKDQGEYSAEKETFTSPGKEIDKNGEQKKPSEVLGAQQAGHVENKVHEEPFDTAQIQDMLQICHTSDLLDNPSYQKSETSASLDFQLQEESLIFKDVIHSGYTATKNRRKLGSSRRNKERQHPKDLVSETDPQPKDDDLENTSADDAPLTTKSILTTETNSEDLNPAEAVTKLQSPENESTENLREERNCVSQSVIKNTAVGIPDALSSTDEFFKMYEDSDEGDKNYVKDPDNLSVHTGSEMLQINPMQLPQDLFGGDESDIQIISSHDDNKSLNTSIGHVLVQKEVSEVHNMDALSCDKDYENRLNDGVEIVDRIVIAETSMDVTSSAVDEVEGKCKDPTDKVLVTQNLSSELVVFSKDAADSLSDESGMSSAMDVSKKSLKEEMDLGHIESLQVKSQQKKRKFGSTRRSQLKRKQEEERDKDETTESDFNSEAEVRNLKNMKAVEELPLCVEVSQLKNMPPLSTTASRELPNETSSAHVQRSEVQSSSSDLQSSDSNMTPAMNDLMGLLPEQSDSCNLEIVNSVTSIKVEDVENEERTMDASKQPSQIHSFVSTAVQMTSGENAGLIKLQNNENTGNTSVASFVSSCETTQSAYSEEKPESAKVTQEQFTDEKISNTVDGDAQGRSLQTKSSSPSSNSTNRRRKMGSTRKSLSSRAKREELHQGQEEDNEETEPQTPVEDVSAESVPEIKELHSHTEDNNGDSEQSKEKVFEKVECTQVVESHLKPLAQPVSQGQPVTTEPQLDAGNLPSIAPKSDPMSELVPAGRRRKMGSHRKSRGHQHQKDQEARMIGAENWSSVTEEDEIKAAEEHRDESMVPGKTSVADGSEKKPASSIIVSKVREDLRPVSKETPVQPIHADVRLGYDSQRQYSLAVNPRGAEPRSDRYNVVMIGDSSVGKTSFIKRAQSGKFSLDLPASVGLDSCMWTVVVDGKPVVLHVWDTAGQERFRSITRQIFHRAQAFILMYDICSSQSFSSVCYWANCIQDSAAEDVVVLLLGNKNDCTSRQVETQAGESLAQEYNFGFAECSAATGDNVIQSLETVARMLSQRFDSRREAAVLHKEPEQKKQSRCC